MKDITSKRISLRTAKACAYLFFDRKILDTIKNNEVPKGNIFEIAKTAGMLAAKKTPELIPHCHTISIDSLDIQFQTLEKENVENFLSTTYDSGIYIEVQAKSIGRTGLEMEALTCASTTALVLYDLLKPVTKDMEIGFIRLLEKTGGKTDPKYQAKPDMNACILVCSDSTFAGKREDNSGKVIQSFLEKHNISVHEYCIVPDDIDKIQEKVKDWASKKVTFIFTTGGTGLSPKDLTIEAVQPLLEREIPGPVEAMRSYGLDRTPWAMLSRSVAGHIGKTLVVTLPGSSNGAKESMEALIPGIFHARKMLGGGGH